MVSTMDHRVIHLGLLLPCVPHLYPLTASNRITWFDLVLAGLAVAAECIYSGELESADGQNSTTQFREIILGCALFW